MQPIDGSDPVENFIAISNELTKFSDELLVKERWLILNKVDVLPPDEIEKHCNEIVKRLDWKGRVFVISGLTKFGLEELGQQTMRYIDGSDGKEEWELDDGG